MALAGPVGAGGDDPAARGFDPDTHRFALGLDPDFMVETAAVAPEGSHGAALELDLVHGLLALRSGDQKLGYVLGNRLQADLMGAYSFGWVEVGAHLPVALWQQSDLTPLTSLGVSGPLVAPIAGTALGDLRLQGKLRLLSERTFPLGLAALLDLRLPTGDKQAFTGDGFMAVPGVAASRRLGKVRLDAQLGYVFRKPGQYLQLVAHDAFAFGLGASLDLPPTRAFRAWRAIAEVTGQFPRGNDASTTRYRAPLAARAGLRVNVWRSLFVDVGLGTGIGEGGYGRESWRIFGGVRWQSLVDPHADRDGDGVPDVNDECPDEKGPRELDGCPDRDGDGVPDYLDRCPDQKGPKELDGCPDRDGDGVPDIDDKCPDEPGPAQNDGCPGEAVVEIETERLSLKDAINFDLGKDTIRPDSHKILGEVVNVLKAHPEIRRIRIEGHTDNIGGAAYNKDLSQRRAQSVVNYLVSKGVPRNRLIPVGYGFDRPVATNATALGRAKNRRVEFTILSEQTDEK